MNNVVVGVNSISLNNNNKSRTRYGDNAPAQPFARRALSENIQAATDEFINQYNKALDRAIKRGQR